MSKEDYTVGEAAAYLGITRRTLDHHIQTGKITPDIENPKPRRLAGREGKPPTPRFTKAALDAYAATRTGAWRSPAVWAEIERRYRAGESAPALAKEFHVSAGHIWNRVGGGRRTVPASTWADILRRRHAGELVVDLAREYGISPRTIYNRVHAEKRAG